MSGLIFTLLNITSFLPDNLSVLKKRIMFRLGDGFCWQKKLSSKVENFHQRENSSPIAGIKASFKNAFPLDGKKTLIGRGLKKIYKKWFLQATNSVSTTHDEAFVEKYASTKRENFFFWQDNRRKWFPLAGKRFIFLKIHSP